MMERGVALLPRIPLEHREVDHPQRPPAVLDQAQVLAELHPERPERIVDDLRCIRAEEDEIAVPGGGSLHDSLQRIVGQELDDGRLQPAPTRGEVVHLDVGEALRTMGRHEPGVVVDGRAGQPARARRLERGHPAARIVGRPREDLELRVRHQIADLHQLQGVAQIGPIGAEARRRLFVGHAGERVRQRHAQHPVEDVAHQRLHPPGNALEIEERGLDVELGELRLPIRAQILVAEAAHDLVVAFEPRHHQELLEDLGRLRQCEEAAGVGAARDEVVARAFRRRSREHRGLDVDEAFGVQELPHRTGDARPRLDAREHLRTAQIDVPVPETGLLSDVVLVELERGGPRGIQDFEALPEDLDRTGRHLGVGGARRPLPHAAHHPQDVLRPHLLGGTERFDRVGVAHHLHEPGAVAQIDEDHASVVAAPMHPAAERDALSDQILGDGAAEMGAHRTGAGGNEARDGKDWRFVWQLRPPRLRPPR